eukprot:scaffold1541_cov256-Pinguiococcus_pyrenoidosus.AAC.42
METSCCPLLSPSRMILNRLVLKTKRAPTAAAMHATAATPALMMAPIAAILRSAAASDDAWAAKGKVALCSKQGTRTPNPTPLSCIDPAPATAL